MASDSHLGARIRQLRQEQGMTARAFAGMIGASPSYVSQLERDLVEPSLSSLRKIAAALKVPVYQFLVNGEASCVIIPRERRKKLELPHSLLQYEFLTPLTLSEGRQPNMVGIFFTMADVEGDQSVEDLRHEAEEFIHVLSGACELTVEDDVYVMRSGDSAYLQKNVPHRMRKLGAEPVFGISVLSPKDY